MQGGRIVVAGSLAVLAAAYLLGRKRGRRRSSRTGRLESRWVEVDGRAVHVRVSLDSVPAGRTPVVLVHGLGMSSRYMMPLARQLAPDIRVYAPDLPGFGLSDKPSHVLSVSELADALAAVMDAMGLRRAALLGNSFGCDIAVEFALRHPRRVERLVLQGPSPDPKVRSVLQQVAMFFVTGLFERWSLGWVALSDYARSGMVRFIRTFREMIAHRIEDRLPEVPAPTLVVWGTRDYLVPRGYAQDVARLLPDGRLAVVPGAAHGMIYSHPRMLKKAVSPFLVSPAACAGRSDGSSQPLGQRPAADRL